MPSLDRLSTPRWCTPFLKALASGASIGESCEVANIGRTAVYERRIKDKEFAAAYDAAMEASADLLESEARRRAIDGVEEPVIYQGQRTPIWETDTSGQPVLDDQGRMVQALDPMTGEPKWLTVRKPSDQLLTLLLKGRRKAVFSDRTEITGADGGALAITDQTARAARVAALLAQAQVRKDATADPGVDIDDLV